LAEAQSTYVRTRVRADELWAEIKKNAPRAYAPPLTPEQGVKVLPSGTLFVAFSVGEEQTHLFLLRSDPSAALPLAAYAVSITSKELEALVQALRQSLESPKNLARTLSASRALFTRLFPPQAQAALQAAPRLLVSPDGPLWDVPFAALVTNAQGSPKYLGADKAITYTQSLTLFAQSRQDVPQLAKGQKPSALVVGDPIFDRKTVALAATTPLRPLPRGERGYLMGDGQPPTPLPHTRTEAVKIAQLYSSVALTEREATEAALRERIATADVIHMATHGYFFPARAMSSGVLLTAPEKEPEIGDTNNDGVLQAWEIYSQLKLKAELVVLSACETGRGKNVRGEGLIGLTRALQYAGARSVLASQWKVADFSTAKLMLAFHHALRGGLAKDEALRRAMALVRQNPGTAHPYFWAPFFLTGDPSNPNLGTEPKRR
jgi:CHAT domain-containing protein